MIKLGTFITDKASDIRGMLTVYKIDMSSNEHYLFQPAGLNPKTKQPLDSFWINEKRIIGGEEMKLDLPIHVLGTHVEDEPTTFNGMAIGLYYHLNGCIHFEVKPAGTLEKTGETIAAKEFDIRRLKGIAIKPMDEKQLSKSKEDAPSPESYPAINL